jgi:hypothetical protein
VGKVLILANLAQDNIHLRVNGFQTLLSENFPGLQVMQVVNPNKINGQEFSAIMQECIRDISGACTCYGADTQSTILLVNSLLSHNIQPRYILVSHDLTDKLAQAVKGGDDHYQCNPGSVRPGLRSCDPSA